MVMLNIGLNECRNTFTNCVVEEGVDINGIKFIELPTFEKACKDLGLNQSDISIIHGEILKKKDILAPLRGLRGAKKLRVALPNNNRGKSGGARIISIELVVDEEIYLIYAFSKKDKDNLNTKETKMILSTVNNLKGGK